MKYENIAQFLKHMWVGMINFGLANKQWNEEWGTKEDKGSNMMQAL